METQHAVKYVVEIYNRYERIRPESRKERFAGVGFRIYTYVGGRRTYDNVREFGLDEAACRAEHARLQAA